MLAVNFLAIVLPLAGAVAAALLLWGWGFSWTHLLVLVGMYLATGLGITIGYHRLFTHKSFQAAPAVQVVLGILGSMAVEGPLFRWVATHRCHHKHSDRTNDPHSPHLHGEGWWGLLAGLWHAHCGWLFERDQPRLYRYIPDLLNQRSLRAINRGFPIWVVLGLLIPTVLGGLLTWSWSGLLMGFLWGGMARIFLVHHMTWSINSICHVWGTRPFHTPDESRNNFVFGILGMGEGWHNNHHAFPASARHGLRWWEIDVSYWLIRGMAAIGLAWDVRVPDWRRLEAKREAGVEAAAAGS